MKLDTIKSWGRLFGLLALLGVTPAWATVPLYENNAPVTFPPQIDASAFVNRSTFDVFTGLPFDFSNCLNYTNTGSGTMSGAPGFFFTFVTNQTWLAADHFVNQGQISVSTNLLVFATNILSTGDLLTGAGGIIKLYATNQVDVERTGLRSGPGDEFFFDNIILGGNVFFPDPGMSDVYWGAGLNNRLDNADRTMRLLSFNGFSFGAPNFGVPYASSPSHQVLFRGSTFTNTTVVPGGFFGFGFANNLYDVLVWTNAVTPTNWVIQMIFYPTNSADTNFQSEARFASSFGDFSGRSRAMVQFRTVDFDIVLQRDFTNFVYVIDDTATVTNVTLQRNANDSTTRRPSTLAVTRGQPFDWNFTNFFGYTPFTNDLVINPSYQSNAVNLMYAAYGAQIGEATADAGFGFGFSFFPPVTTEPTNMPGRVEIVGDQVNLDQTRVRAESVFSVKTKNLTSNIVAQVDAPFLMYDITSVEPTLTITNLAPPTVRRLSGEVNAWSGVWTNGLEIVTPTPTNTFLTNVIEIAFHALVVENQLTTIRPVVVHEFAAHATNVVVADNLSIGRSLLIEATNLQVNGALELPPGSDWGATNFVGLANLTNRGVIAIPGAGFFGAVPSPPYDNFVNDGIINGATHVIRANYFENRGLPTLANSGAITANAGLLSIQTRTGLMTNAQLRASGDIEIFADSLTNSATTFQAGLSNFPGALIVSVTNGFYDGSGDTENLWTSSAGFQFRHKPLTGDLLGTTLESRIERLSGRADHFWAGENRGANTNGYLNNMALGVLRLDGPPGSLFVFSGTSGTNGDNALYVDYLDLVNNATNYNSALRINPGLTIYFANANLPVEKLNGRHSGRLVWVSDYTGLRSSTNITYPSGQTFTFNLALARSRDIDSDGDGFANADDATPFPVPAGVGLTIEWLPGLPNGNGTRVGWDAPADAVNVLEYTTSLAPPLWQTATNFTTGSQSARVMVTNAVSPASSRFYRVRIEQP